MKHVLCFKTVSLIPQQMLRNEQNGYCICHQSSCKLLDPCYMKIKVKMCGRIVLKKHIIYQLVKSLSFINQKVHYRIHNSKLKMSLLGEAIT